MSRKRNPEDAATRRDVDNVIAGSGSNIDAIYDEYYEAQQDLKAYEDIKENLEEADRSVPQRLRDAIRDSKVAINDLDGRIVRYGEIMLDRIRRRIDIIRNSPGSALKKGEIRDVDRDIFKLEAGLRKRGVDIRKIITPLMGKLVTLEQDSGILIQRPAEPLGRKSKKKMDEAEFLAALMDQWRRVYKNARNDPRVQDDIEWISAQLRSIDVNFKRNKPVRRAAERVARRIMDVHNRTKPRKELRSYDDAMRGVKDFADVIQRYSESEVTPAGVDRLQRKLEEFSREFDIKSRSEWDKSDSRKFANNLRSLRKATEALRPKRGRKKNPCIGLHFHGKDADELMAAAEKSAIRSRGSGGLIRKANPTPEWKRLINRCQSLWDRYCDKPTKKNLTAVLRHLDTMKASKSKKVKDERSACLRIANKESKRLGVK